MPKRPAIVALALAAFGASLWSPFFFDDYALATDPAVTRPTGLLELLALERTRPLTFVTFWANFRIGGFEPFGYHAVNLLLFAATVWIAGGVFRLVARGQAWWIALAVFALHPLQTEPAVYVFARATLLATLFSVLSWRAWLDGAVWQAVSWFALAMLAKEEAAALPVFLAGFEWFHRKRREGWASLAAPLAAMFGLVVLFGARLLYATHAIEGSGAGLELGKITPWTYLLTQGRALWLYLRLFVAPYGQNFDRDFPLSTGLDAEVVLAWTGVAALVLGALWLANRWPPAWWLAGGLVLLAPTSSFAPLADLTAERRMFLPMLSLALFAGCAVAHLAGRRAGAVGIALAVVLAGFSYRRTQVFGSEVTLWRDTAVKSPAKVRPKLQLARALETEGPAVLSQRKALLERARGLAPDDPEVLGEIGVFRLQASEPARAAEAFERAIVLDPSDAQLHTNLGTALAMLGRANEAERSFIEALRLDECNFDARNNLMLVLNRRGAAAEAKALAAPPADCPFSQEQLDALRSAREAP